MDHPGRKDHEVKEMGFAPGSGLSYFYVGGTAATAL